MNKLKDYLASGWFWLRKNFLNIVVLFIVFTFGWVLLLRFVPVPFTYLMVKRSITDEGSLKYDWVSWDRISPAVKVCAMASEDQNLPFHYGIDFGMMGKALQVNKKGRKVFGASTITQQVAKNVFLFPERSYIRKGLEMYFALLIETLWPKERILEVYLNVAEMGTLVFGVESASQKYFKKPASRLSVRESAAIIASLPNPRKYNVANPGSYMQRRQSEIVSLYGQLDGTNYLRELYVHSEKSLYDFRKYKK
jgi:monofunctional glycosyltransferase